MAGFESNDFSAPRETRSPSLTTVELVDVGGREVGRYTFEPGWRWSECIKPVTGTDSCQVEHLGYMVSWYTAPGHDAWVTSDEPAVLIEFADPADYAKG